METREIDDRIRVVEARIEEIKRLRAQAPSGTDAKIARVYRPIIGVAILLPVYLSILRPAVLRTFMTPIVILGILVSIEAAIIAVIAWRTYGWSRTTWNDWLDRMVRDPRTPIGAYVDTQRVCELTRLHQELEWLQQERPRAFEAEQRHIRTERAVRRYDRKAAAVGLSAETRQKMTRSVRAGHAEDVRRYLGEVRETDALVDGVKDLGEDFRRSLVAFLRSHDWDISEAQAFVATERGRRLLLADAQELGFTDVTRADLDGGKEAEVRARIGRARELRDRRATLNRLEERIARLASEHQSEPRQQLVTARVAVEQPRSYRKALHELTAAIERAEVLAAAKRRRG